MLSWLLGSFISSEWKESAIVLAYAVPGIVVLLGFGRVLNVLQLSEDHAAMLGVPVEKVKLLLIAAATLVTAAAVSFSGLIGFVGLVAPHAVRLVWGPDYRFLLPMSAIVGATFLVPGGSGGADHRISGRAAGGCGHRLLRRSLLPLPAAAAAPGDFVDMWKRTNGHSSSVNGSTSSPPTELGLATGMSRSAQLERPLSLSVRPELVEARLTVPGIERDGSVRGLRGAARC